MRTRQPILDAAHAVFVREGFTRAKIEPIAKTTSLPTPSADGSTGISKKMISWSQRSMSRAFSDEVDAGSS